MHDAEDHSENRFPQAAPSGSIEEASPEEMTRLKGFLVIQFLFLLASPLAGGFHYRVWSMLDTALLVLSIGIGALAFVLETRRARRSVFQISAVLYVLAVVDMSINVLISGFLGWQGVGLPG
ncbi:MAG: hypothetical protein FJY73_07015 [Candidatus Eisenbacteria bacterium]|nr:hypothetical protein [Candidatus Eisenbacteria bacterium]